MTKNEILTTVNALASIVEDKQIDYQGCTQAKMERDILELLPRMVDLVNDLKGQVAALNKRLQAEAKLKDEEVMKVRELQRQIKYLNMCNYPLLYNNDGY